MPRASLDDYSEAAAIFGFFSFKGIAFYGELGCKAFEKCFYPALRLRDRFKYTGLYFGHDLPDFVISIEGCI